MSIPPKLLISHDVLNQTFEFVDPNKLPLSDPNDVLNRTFEFVDPNKLPLSDPTPSDPISSVFSYLQKIWKRPTTNDISKCPFHIAIFNAKVRAGESKGLELTSYITKLTVDLLAIPLNVVCTKKLTGYTSNIAFSPNGTTIAYGSRDNTIKLLDSATGTLKQTLTGHTDSINCVAFSPHGSTIASASDDRTIKLWNSATGTLKQTLSGHTGIVTSVAFSPDGATIASGSYDENIKIWDSATGTLKQTLRAHTNTTTLAEIQRGLTHIVTSVAFSPDGATITSGFYRENIKIWDSATGTLKQTLTGHQSCVNSLAFIPDGDTIASVSWDKTIKLWDSATGTLKQTLTGHPGHLISVAISPDGSKIATKSNDRTIRIWDLYNLDRLPPKSKARVTSLRTALLKETGREEWCSIHYPLAVEDNTARRQVLRNMAVTALVIGGLWTIFRQKK